MPNRLSLLAAALLTALAAVSDATPASAQPPPTAAFEGVIRYAARDASGPHVVTYTVANGRLRVDVRRTSEESSMIVDRDARLLYVLLPARQTYLVIRRATLELPSQLPDSVHRPSRTGRRRRIAGRRCDVWLLRYEGWETELCADTDLGEIPRTSGWPAESRWGRGGYHQMLDQGVLPLLAVTRDGSGREISRLEATRVDRGRPDRALFLPPPDYRQLVMPAPRGPSLR